MSQQHVSFVYPGDLDTRTGGYRYDKRIVEELTRADVPKHQWNVTLLSLPGDYPFPTSAQLTQAQQQIADIPDGSLTVIDGLAYSVIPDVIKQHTNRLTFVALIHHPLALETGLSKLQSEQLKTLETRALQYASHVITTSELTALSLADYRVSPEIISAVLPGTDSADIATGSDSGCVNILCVATLTQRKGHSVLLDALAQLDDIPWHLICAGSVDRDNKTYQQLKQQCKQNDIVERVSFVGELSDSELDHQYAKADLFVLASYHEGYGMVLTEAIARGLPIVCSNAGAMPHTVPEGAGILVPPGDSMALSQAIDSYLRDGTLRAQLKQTALRAREQLRDWREASLDFSQVLHHVVDTKTS